ncbi:vesicle transport protein SFT2C [Strigops habroptila]|uniref:Vesicle transport protein n=1 Tax=Strigops habroptila TaxID=2489341 RepID=A0A672UGR2_STRHB|nr:vesicle transport protein SFT2C [Strigops habroptila]XP_030351860.1 vesicle transport protein SFT2C [Strigops habroptila]XP_030351861.1 vesicle transport protein SFT2C [Strigops habroptila]XP_030351863.1 vesicle transport protein SFT2C [Strigops habroptila]XP_030351864.1 vesicle transport protein SFT2C [Strigops habroptila]
MADLGRQLQEYLAQSKATTAAASSAAPAPPPAGCSQEEAAGSGGLGAWLGPLNPFPPGRGAPPAAAGPGSGSGSGSGWPWAAEADPCLPGLSRWQRLAGSGLCLLLAALCFGLAALYVPLLLLRARKFALLWSLGSLCALSAAALLRGPARLLREPSRGSLLYFGALGGTLYAALGLRSTLLTALGAAVQLGTAAAALLAALPGGAAGLRRLGGLLCAAVRRGGKALPV